MDVIVKDNSPADTAELTSNAATIVMVLLGLLFVVFLFITLAGPYFAGRDTPSTPVTPSAQQNGSLSTNPIVNPPVTTPPAAAPTTSAPLTPGNPAAPNPY